MRFIHTADWHIGKIVNEFSMLDDQRYILDNLVDLLDKEKPDALVIAGDLYDRSVPPAKAVELLNEYFSKIVLELGIPIIAISGNHDSGERLSFASSLLQKQGLYIEGELKRNIKPVTIKDTDFYLIPYCDPALVRHIYEENDIKTHEEAMQKIISEINLNRDKNKKAVIVAHGYISNLADKENKSRDEILKESGLELSDSERPLSMGGTDIISAKVFDGFDYVALGHLHGAQKVGSDRVRYSGSPLKYSFSEENHKKSLTFVDISEDNIKIELKPLVPTRDMRSIRGNLEELINKEFYNESNINDYVFAYLTDEGELHEPMASLRAVYPNIMGLKRAVDKTLDFKMIEVNKAQREKSKIELFKDFYENVTQTELSSERENIVLKIIEEVEGEI